MRRIACVLVALAALTFGACSSGGGESSEKSTPATTSASAKMSRAEFDAITNGMTYDQVVGIVGSPGWQRFHAENNGAVGLTDDIYQWDGNGKLAGSTSSVEFNNGIVIGKTQFGLQ